jgi:NADH:ubiquinone oxidoreductase subunit 6 (subunit J)
MSLLPLAALVPLAAINWHTLFFLLFALLACGFAVAVVASTNVVRMALHLVFSLAATAGLFFLAGAEFVGAMQLMIYVGGTLVLLVFGVMLTARAPFVSLATPARDRLLGGVAGLGLLALLVWAVVGVDAWSLPATGTVAEPSATPLGMALLGVRVDGGPGHGRAGYLLPFEIVSVHLLVVLVGAAYLARAKRRRTPRSLDAVASADPVESVSVAPPGAAVARAAPGGSRSALVASTVNDGGAR